MFKNTLFQKKITEIKKIYGETLVSTNKDCILLYMKNIREMGVYNVTRIKTRTTKLDKSV